GPTPLPRSGPSGLPVPRFFACVVRHTPVQRNPLSRQRTAIPCKEPQFRAKNRNSVQRTAIPCKEPPRNAKNPCQPKKKPGGEKVSGEKRCPDTFSPPMTSGISKKSRTWGQAAGIVIV